MHQRQVVKANGVSFALLGLLLACFFTTLPMILCQDRDPVEPFSETTESPDSEETPEPPVDVFAKANCTRFSNEQQEHKDIAERLVNICESCSELYRETSLLEACSQECFSTMYFRDCVDKLLKLEEKAATDRLKDMIATIHDELPLV